MKYKNLKQTFQKFADIASDRTNRIGRKAFDIGFFSFFIDAFDTSPEHFYLHSGVRVAAILYIAVTALSYAADADEKKREADFVEFLKRAGFLQETLDVGYFDVTEGEPGVWVPAP